MGKAYHRNPLHDRSVWRQGGGAGLQAAAAVYPGAQERAESEARRQGHPWGRLQSGRHVRSLAYQFLREVRGEYMDEFIPVEKYLFSQFGGNISRDWAGRAWRGQDNQRVASAQHKEIRWKMQ
jgi:hypothetical protein